MRIGSGYLGSESILTSQANQEVIPNAPSDWTFDKYKLYKFSFVNEQACTVKINNDDPILLKADQGFEMNQYDALLYSFVIVEPNIQYQWIGCY